MRKKANPKITLYTVVRLNGKRRDLRIKQMFFLIVMRDAGRVTRAFDGVFLELRY